MVFLTWLAGIFAPVIINKLWALVDAEGKTLLQKYQAWYAAKQQVKADAGTVTTYQGTLQNGTTEQNQINASLDVLNGSDISGHKP